MSFLCTCGRAQESRCCFSTQPVIIRPNAIPPTLLSSLLTTLLLLLLTGCQTEDYSDLSATELHRHLQQNQLEGNDVERRALLAATVLSTDVPDSLSAAFTLYQAENASETLHYEDALRLGRQAISKMKKEATDDQLPNLFRAANLLAKLHHEHWKTLDSITFYCQLARTVRQQLPPSHALDLEVALLRQLDHRTNYLWPEIDADITHLTTTDTYTQPALYDTKATLKVLHALSIRKQRFEVLTPEGRDSLFAHSLEQTKEAITLFKKQTSPKIGYALEGFGLHQAMLGSDEEFAAACQDITDAQPPGLPVRYGYPTRLKAIRASKNGLAAAVPLFKEVYPSIPAFNVALRDEASYFLEEVAKQEKDHQQLWELSLKHLTDGRCGTFDVITPGELTDLLPQTNVCPNILINFAVAKRLEYENTGSTEALELAEQYNDFLLRRWTEDRAGSNERSLLYQFYAFGAEGLENTIITSQHRYNLNGDRAAAFKLFEHMEAAKSLLLRRDLSQRNQALGAPRFRLQDSLSLVQEQLSMLTFARSTTGADFRASTDAQLNQLTQQQARLQQQLRSVNDQQKRGLLFNVKPPTRVQLARENILSFSWTTQGLYALTISNQQEKVYRISTDGLAGQIDSLRALFLETTPNTKDVTAYQQLAHQLYQQLIQPAAAVLTPGKPLLIIPDNQLSKLPFEALLTKAVNDPKLTAKSPFLLHRQRIRYAPSWSVDQLQTPLRPLTRNTASVAVLAHTQLHRYFDEIHQQLRSTTAGYREHVGMVATNQLQQLTSTANVFHLSAHAEGNPNQLQNNLIHLSPDDRINAAIMEDLDLSGKLVVLAACETGIGQQRDGEGVYTISRSFRLAGASGVVSSLWQVKSKPTKELMKSFYKELFQGVAPEEALWRAKVKMAGDKGLYWWPGAWSGVVG